MVLTAASLIALALVGVCAGLVGALVGIGGGLVIVPVLLYGFSFPPHASVAASLVSVVATSTSASTVYVKSGLANMRLGMSLEVATTLGGLTGGLLAAQLSGTTLSAVFGVVMGITAVLMFRGRDTASKAAKRPPSMTSARGWEEHGALAGGYVDERTGDVIAYRAERLPLGMLVSFVAGGLSGLLGIGGGFLKVPAMSLGMRVPIRVATATSNFMLGVTASTSLFVYFAHGDVHPRMCAPIAVGVVLGALAGARLMSRVPVKLLRTLVAVVLLVVGAQMLWKAVTA